MHALSTSRKLSTVFGMRVLLKLQRAGINGKTYELIKSMYHGSIFRIKCKNLLTDPVIIS